MNIIKIGNCTFIPVVANTNPRHRARQHLHLYNSYLLRERTVCRALLVQPGEQRERVDEISDAWLMSVQRRE